MGGLNLECGELLHGRFPLKLKGAVHKSYVRPAILHGSEAWCLKEIEIGILRRIEISMVRTICVVQLKDRKRSTDLMFMLDLSGLWICVEHVDLSSVCWYVHVLRRDGGLVLRKALDFEVESQREKGRLKRKWKKQVEDESVKVGLRKENALYRSVECWRKSDCCWVGVNLATSSCWGYYQTLNIDVSLSLNKKIFMSHLLIYI